MLIARSFIYAKKSTFLAICRVRYRNGARYFTALYIRVDGLANFRAYFRRQRKHLRAYENTLFPYALFCDFPKLLFQGRQGLLVDKRSGHFDGGLVDTHALLHLSRGVWRATCLAKYSLFLFVGVYRLRLGIYPIYQSQRQKMVEYPIVVGVGYYGDTVRGVYLLSPQTSLVFRPFNENLRADIKKRRLSPSFLIVR